MPTIVRWASYLIVFFAMLRGTSAQQPPSSFRVCLGYVSSFKELNSRFDEHWRDGAQLIQERREATVRLVEAKGTIEYFLNQQELGLMAALQTQFAGSSVEAQLNELVNQKAERFTPRVRDPRYTPQETFRQFAAQVPEPAEGRTLVEEALDLRVQLDRLVHALKTVERGGKLATQRYMSLVQELQKIATETQHWQSKSHMLVADYWELADVEAVKSDVELRMALRELERAAPTNVGALLAKSITLMRLGENDDAMRLLNRLAHAPQTHLIAIAARAELFARLGDSRSAASDLRSTLPAGQADVRIRMHRALAFAATGDLKQSEKEWEVVLKLGGHNIAAYRALAIINATLPAQSDRTRKKAMENARLATQLASDDWSCELAFALASVACGESAQGELSAVRASDLTVGHNQVLCSQLALQIQSGQPITWEF